MLFCLMLMYSKTFVMGAIVLMENIHRLMLANNVRYLHA